METELAAHPVSPDTRELALNPEISRHAYDLWERYGRPEGRDVDIWLEAERQLLGADRKVNQHAGAAVPAKPLADALYAAQPGIPGASRPQPPTSTPQAGRRR